jgi:hypothetical protein
MYHMVSSITKTQDLPSCQAFPRDNIELSALIKATINQGMYPKH